MNLTEMFGPVWDGAGTRGFSGEGYWYHKFVPLSFKDSTFVSKTITLLPTKGNMKLTDTYAPAHLFPDCIYIDPFSGMAVNSVGLSGPGLEAFLATGRWQAIRDPFFISFMPTSADEIAETRAFAEILSNALPEFKTTQLGIQLNISCPNAGIDINRNTVKKTEYLLDELTRLDLPVVVKLNLLMDPAHAIRIGNHPTCAGICIANTIPFGTKMYPETWNAWFPKGSPIERRNPDYKKGGLSGHHLLGHVVQWVREYRVYDKKTHLNAGGGVMHDYDVDLLFEAGANSVFFATAAMLRPWRVESIIRRAHQL